MFRERRDVFMPAFVVGGLLSLIASGPGAAADPAAQGNPTAPVRRNRLNRKPGAPDMPKTADEAAGQAPPLLNLLDALRAGQIEVQAKGMDDGRMTVSLTNRTHKSPRVVPPASASSPPGLSGQFGGMGGMGAHGERRHGRRAWAAWVAWAVAWEAWEEAWEAAWEEWEVAWEEWEVAWVAWEVVWEAWVAVWAEEWAVWVAE